jgi:hypothetical protein
VTQCRLTLCAFQKLGDAFQDWYRLTFGNAATAAVLTHCRRELMQAIWLILLDKDFMHAYQFGIIMEFADGIMRRVFPRFFTYSADYPEKSVCFDILMTSKFTVTQGFFWHVSNILDLFPALGVWWRNQRYQHLEVHETAIYALGNVWMMIDAVIKSTVFGHGCIQRGLTSRACLLKGCLVLHR